MNAQVQDMRIEHLQNDVAFYTEVEALFTRTLQRKVSRGLVTEKALYQTMRLIADQRTAHEKLQRAKQALANAKAERGY